MLRCGEVGYGRRGESCCVHVCRVMSGHGKAGSVGRGESWLVWERFGTAGEASRVMERLGTFRYGSAGKARRCAVS